MTGDGTKLSPFLVSNVADFVSAVAVANAYIRINRDIDFDRTSLFNLDIYATEIDLNMKTLENIKVSDYFIKAINPLTIKNGYILDISAENSNSVFSGDILFYTVAITERVINPLACVNDGMLRFVKCSMDIKCEDINDVGVFSNNAIIKYSDLKIDIVSNKSFAGEVANSRIKGKYTITKDDSYVFTNISDNVIMLNIIADNVTDLKLCNVSSGVNMINLNIDLAESTLCSLNDIKSTAYSSSIGFKEIVLERSGM